MKFTHNLSVLLLPIILLTGCAKEPHYTPKKLSPITHKTADYVQTKNDVTLRVKKLTYEETRTLFGDNAYRLYNGHNGHKGLLPIQISVENKGATSWELNQEGVSLKLASNREIASKLKYSSSGKIVSHTIIGGFCAAICTITALPFIVTAALAMPALAVPFGIAFIGGGIGAGTAPFIGVNQAFIADTVNAKIDMDLLNKALDSMVIEPGTTQNTLIFVKKKSYRDEFTLKLIPAHESEGPLSFNVCLAQEDKFIVDKLNEEDKS